MHNHKHYSTHLTDTSLLELVWVTFTVVSSNHAPQEGYELRVKIQQSIFPEIFGYFETSLIGLE